MSAIINERLCRQLVEEYYRRTQNGERQAVILRELMQVTYAQGHQAAQQNRPAVNARGRQVDALSNFIREIDGGHSLGAGALAERICEWLASGPVDAQADARDAKRLDWLQQSKCSVYRVIDEIRRPTTEFFMSYETVSSFVGWSVDNGHTTHDTVRDAIDAAMKEQP